MDIGWCAPIDDAPRVKTAGCDFIEVGLAPMRLEDDAAFKIAKRAVSAISLPVPVFNRFLPTGMHVVGPAVDRPRIQRYLERVAAIVSDAGAEIVVFGSGWARHVPDGWSRNEADRQFRDMVTASADVLARVGATLALESQNDHETNYLTTLAEAVEMARSVNHPNVRVMTDTYHLHEMSEPLTLVAHAAPWLAHVHVSDSGRELPGEGTYAFDPFFACLRDQHYRGKLSLEMMREVSDDEMTRALSHVRACWSPGSPGRA